MLRLRTSFSGEHFNLNAGADEVLSSIHEPLHGGNDKDNSECRNTVVC